MVFKKIAGLAIVLLLLSQVVSGTGFVSKAYASSIDDVINIIDSAELTVLDAGNNPVPLTELLEQGAKVNLAYSWSLPNGHGFKEGDTFTFGIPDEFLLFNDISGELMLDPETTVGTFAATASTHQVVMTFNDYITDHDDVGGILKFSSQFDKQKITGSTTHAITIPTKGGTTVFTLRFKPTVTSTIEKSGVPAGYNPKSIDWTVDVNKALDTVNNAVMTDPIPAGLSMADASSVQVYDLNVNLDGSVAVGGAVDPSRYTADITGGALNVHFADPVTSAYRIKFTTSIDDASKASFSNTAKFMGDNKPEVTSNSTVNVNYGKLLDKSSTGYDSNTQTISWAINYNYKEQAIDQTDALLADTFNDVQELVPGSIAVYPVTFDINGNGTKGAALPGSDYTVTPTNDPAQHLNGFNLQFNNAVTSAYKVEYQTRSIDRVDGSGATNIVNKVTANGAMASASRGIKQVILQKGTGTIDYAAQTVSWRIRLNEDSKTMSNAQLIDEFTKGGMQLVPGSLSITPDSGTAAAYTVTEIASPTPAVNDGFKIQFTEAIHVPYTITYTTKYNNDWLNSDWITTNASYPNHTTVDWDENAAASAVGVTATFNPNNETKANGYKKGSYNAATKEITWTVGVNYNRKTLANAIVQDQLLAGQKLIPESLHVYNMTVPANGNPAQGTEVDAAEYTVNYTGDVVKVTFNQPISAGYILVFSTSLADDLIDASIGNTAQLLDGTKSESKDLTASVNIPQGGEYVNKDGQQNGGKISWTIYINRGQSTVNDALVTDEPTDNQLLIPESFNLYPTTVAASGTVTKVNTPLVKGTDYTLAIETDPETGKQLFKLAFLHQITSAYVLEYQSLIVAQNGDTVSNKVSFSGNNVQAVTKDSAKDIVVGVSDGSGTGSGVRGALTVLKQDGDTQAALSGATFALYRQSGSDRILVNTLTTGADGKVEFKKLLYGNYVLIETAAPVGYQLDATERPVKIDSTTAVNLIIDNAKILVSLTVLKQDKDNHDPLSGATYNLFRQSGAVRTLVNTLTTGADGKAVFTNLPYGDYVLLETAAPSGYVLDTTEHPVAINSPTNVEVTLDNVKRPPSPPPVTPTDPEPPTPTLPSDPEPSTPTEPTDPVPSMPTEPTDPEPSTTPSKPVKQPDIHKTTKKDELIESSVNVPLGGIAVVNQGPKHGEVIVKPDGSWTYKPDKGYTGKDRFTIIVKNKDGNATETLITITVDGVPLGTIDSGTPTLPKTGEGSQLGIRLVGLAIILVGVFLMSRRIMRKAE
ncbi:LPXTG-motif cell wall-anchored protein [Paenibacillus sp. BK033]|uniref:collagen binding domain-containing protein n=1 Tax=Paenibacillus sp. BK033 TaxID=2512133 RepID=UPI001044B4BC|nr:collagen binding domain-containing protein [Paenibacillus sp. BK033]TCM99581.1 LPXTG-motif cell wall-anchored protein [Paenibacillus sp. BK033]